MNPLYASYIDKNKIPDAEHKCQSCNRKWEQKPEPVTCICGSMWVDWINWEQWQKRGYQNK